MRTMRILEDRQLAARIPVHDPQRAKSVYAEKLGHEPSVEMPESLLYRCGEGEFALFESVAKAGESGM
jgi:hypothetical protein